MNLVIDIGNSAAKAAIFDGQADAPLESLSRPPGDLSFLLPLARRHDCRRAILSSVVDLSAAMRRNLAALPCPVLQLTASTPVPIGNRYRTPETLGTDRLAAAVGAAMRFPERNVLVVDAGTCITYELVTAHGEYLGGNISPGLNLRLAALHQGTGHLPLVSSSDGHARLPLLGYDTPTAIRAGIVRGITYEIEGYVRRLSKKYPDLLVVLTGGDVFHFDNSLKKRIFADKFLVLRGLNQILLYNE